MHENQYKNNIWLQWRHNWISINSINSKLHITSLWWFSNMIHGLSMGCPLVVQPSPAGHMLHWYCPHWAPAPPIPVPPTPSPPLRCQRATPTRTAPSPWGVPGSTGERQVGAGRPEPRRGLGEGAVLMWIWLWPWLISPLIITCWNRPAWNMFKLNNGRYERLWMEKAENLLYTHI